MIENLFSLENKMLFTFWLIAQGSCMIFSSIQVTLVPMAKVHTDPAAALKCKKHMTHENAENAKNT